MLLPVMSSFRVRPRFKQVMDLPPDALRDRIVSHIGDENERFEVKCFPGFICIRIHADDQHFWSPRLHLSLEEAGPGRTSIQGTYGPNANVWSIFFFAYLIVGCLTSAAGIFGISQWIIGARPWSFWLMGAGAAGLAALYLAAQTGQKLGAQQTFLLHQAYESATGQHVTIH